MSSASAVTTLRPLRVGEVLDVAIKIYLRNWRTLLTLVLAVAVPLHVFGIVVTLSTVGDTSVDTTFGTPTVTPSDAAATSAAYLTGQAVVFVLGLVIVTLATAACVKAVSDAYVGERSGWRHALRFAARRTHSALWLTLLTYLGVAVAFLFLVIPAVWLWVSWTVAVPVLLFEGVKGTRALRRSFRLVRGRWWPTLAAVSVGSVLAGVLGAIFQAAFLAPTIGAGGGATGAVVANGVATALGQIVTTPFQAAIVAVVYFDLRVRKEGFDLQLLADRLGLPVPPTGVGPAPRARFDGPDDGERPPYWPPPPGWRPRSERLAGAPED